MKKSAWVWIVVIILIGLGVYFLSRKGGEEQVENQPASTSTGQSDQSAAPSPSGAAGIKGSPNQTNTGEPATVFLKVGHSATLGDYLTASNGMTLYVYKNDSDSISNCYDTCAKSWPPYTVSGLEPLLTDTAITGAVSTAARTDGTMQITYNGQPLYYWINDKKPGDTTGQGVGNVWFVLKP
ncbi:MAG TPA: hypothetical protein VG694_01560 [Candidatus Paceibacterota bacterium]|jgi:predicted lipoprotein with Yx(FWY)xxD motif|nr:hypothetical protein [Candidatus Paceibacterota bacterium]